MTEPKSVVSETENCQVCGRINPVWFAANEVWNAVIPERVGFICPICFIERAERQGFQCAGWQLVPEASSPSPATKLQKHERMAELLEQMATEKPAMKLSSAAPVLLGMLDDSPHGLTDSELQRLAQISHEILSRPAHNHQAIEYVSGCPACESASPAGDATTKDK